MYNWVDEIPLSRPKKNIARDFSDCGKCLNSYSIELFSAGSRGDQAFPATARRASQLLKRPFGATKDLQLEHFEPKGAEENEPPNLTSGHQGSSRDGTRNNRENSIHPEVQNRSVYSKEKNQKGGECPEKIHAIEYGHVVAHSETINAHV